jgi:hypothetical protein
VPDTTLNRKRIFQHLRSVSVFSATKVVQEWSLSHNSLEVVGVPQDGHVAMTANDTSLKIYFAERSVGSASWRWGLTELIADFCGISNDPESKSDSKSLLLLILSDGLAGEVNEILDNNNIPPLISDEDLENDENQSNEKRTRRVRRNTNMENISAHLPGT